MPRDVHAQQCELGAFAETVPACGTGSGYFRPQPNTITNSGRIIENPGPYYAPVGNNDESWYQYYPSKKEYGRKEPNPYDQNGNLSLWRTPKHLWTTRIWRGALNE
jgi:hypothetical protein